MILFKFALPLLLLIRLEFIWRHYRLKELYNISMSHNVTMTSHDTSSSGYRTHEDLHDSKKIVTLEDREKLKEELLRQYEAGQLKPRVILSGSSNTPRQVSDELT